MTGTLIAPGTCPAVWSANGRTSSTVAAPGSASSAGSSGLATHGPWLSETTSAVVGGRGVETDADTSTNSCTSRNRSASFDSRSWAIVDERSLLMFPPHSDPATWPGYTSTPSPSALSFASEWKRSWAPSRAATARSGRAASPTKSESPVSAMRSSTTNAQCSGRCPGVCSTRIRVGSDLEHLAVGQRLERIGGLRDRVDRHRNAVLQREAPVAREMIGMGVRLQHALDPHACLLRGLQVLLDPERRIDDDRDTRIRVADQVRGAPEVVVHELPKEQHGSRG